MIRRRRLLALLALGGLAGSNASNAQQRRVFRLGFLAPGPGNPWEEGFFRTLRALGYTEGQNLIVERRLVPPTELPSMAIELARMQLDVIYVQGSAAVRAATGATRDIPIVATDLETDPVASGYAVSLARPGGNLTGIFLDLPDFSAKRLELLKEALPNVSTVMVLWDSSLDRAPLSKMDAAAGALKLRLVLGEVRNASDLPGVFAAAVRQKVEAVLVMQSPTLDANKDSILGLAAKYRLPLTAVFASFATGGALVSYGPNGTDMVARTATYVDSVLKGMRPGDLPIQRPVKFDLFVNLKTAKSFGLTISDSVLLRADGVLR
jgi:putative ABC transport system substrate-binding protein